MKNDVKMSRKLKFEKPQIGESEFISCGAALLATKIPAAVAIAAACNLPNVAAAMPVAVVY